MSTPTKVAAPKMIDIYQHLKLNMHPNQSDCHCLATPELYCVPCKVTVCKKCNYDKHKNHFLISKEYTKFTPEDISHLFEDAETTLKTSEIFTKSEKFKKKLVDQINAFTKELKEKIDKLKEARLKEIDNMFQNINAYTKNIKEEIEKTKNSLNDYYSKYHSFYQYREQNQDETNTIFLIHYDMVSIIERQSEKIRNLSTMLTEDYENYQKVEGIVHKEIEKEIENILFNTNHEEKLEASINQGLEISSLIRQDLSKTGEAVYSPMNHFGECTDKLNEDYFKEIIQRISKYSKQIDVFKEKVFDCVKAHSNYKDLEKDLTNFENSNQKGMEILFSKRQVPNNAILNAKTTKATTKERQIIPFHSKDEICLNDPFLKKYFSYLIIDLYSSYFRIATKELQSSHADLLIKVDEDKDDGESVKINEGTNVIVLYDKRNNKITKKKLPLTRNPFGYTTFPAGCRWLLLGDKVYITGGKDAEKEYPNVLIYDTKTEKLKRIMDLVIPRSYHTMVHLDAFETIMIIGGEKKGSVEIFDPSINRWLLLPSLIYPRANIFFQFDKPRGIMYALFGCEGKIIDNKYSDVIEYLDLTKLEEGWNKLTYYNKSECKLKTYLNLFPLSNNLLLAYGGELGRDKRKSVCVINLLKGAIEKIDKQLAEQLKTESKKSVRLSTIVSSLNLK